MSVTQSETYLVRDMNAKGKPRTHEVPLGDGSFRSFTFPDESTGLPIPIAAAIKLARIPGFEVKNRDGIVITGQQIEEEDATGDFVTLSADQTIAKFSELTQDALLLRAIDCGEPGRVFKKNSSRDSLIEFLISRNASKAVDSDDEKLSAAAGESEIELELEDAE